MDRARVERAKQADLLTLVGSASNLKRASEREYAGPCPFCGGVDRFSVISDESKWYCRRCTPRGGDAIDYIRKRDDLAFWPAVSKLLRDTSFISGRRGGMGGGTPRQDPAPPSLVWQVAQQRWLTIAVRSLWSECGRGALDWLRARGLQDETIYKAGLGYSVLANAILIPCVVQGTLWSVKRRRLTGGYALAWGSVSCMPYLADWLTGKPKLVLCEGEFDALLLWQECHDLIDVITFGSACARPQGYWVDRVLEHEKVLVSLDTDNAGEQGASYWLGLTNGQGQRLLPYGKDITASYRVGTDLRDWVVV